MHPMHTVLVAAVVNDVSVTASAVCVFVTVVPTSRLRHEHADEISTAGYPERASGTALLLRSLSRFLKFGAAVIWQEMFEKTGVVVDVTTEVGVIMADAVMVAGTLR